MKAAIFIFFLCLPAPSRGCSIPADFQGRYYNTDLGDEEYTTINSTSFHSNLKGTFHCLFSTNTNTTTPQLFLTLASRGGGCLVHAEWLLRTPNILQYKHSSCSSLSFQHLDPSQEFSTLFRIDPVKVSCKGTMEGCFHFTYEVDYGGGSICNSEDNMITACQEPGSVYVDNHVFSISFGKCPSVVTSLHDTMRLQCLGWWQDERGDVWAGLYDLSQVHLRDRFKCMLTRKDQEMDDNLKRYVLSRWASCAGLLTPYDGDIRLILQPALNPLLPSFAPSCFFPRNYSGFYEGDYILDSFYTINSTHLNVITVLNQYEYLESYFVCLKNVGTRYLTYHTSIGRCEGFFVCYDFLPRRANIIRFRMARSLALHDNIDLERVFREACSWDKFTFQKTRNPLEWSYSYLVLFPPAPVTCPIGGRYFFVQEGEEEEKYKTEVDNGFTERPRHMIDCKQEKSEFTSCDSNPFKISIDVSYCETLDHTGKPIGEYDVADRELICVGHFMENMRSYMVTYDFLDSYSEFRCWVYERTGWRNIQMSRSSSQRCELTQKASSNTVKEGSSLKIFLTESERLYDECSQRYDIGNKDTVLDVFLLVPPSIQLSSSSFCHSFFTLFLFNIFLNFDFLVFHISCWRVF